MRQNTTPAVLARAFTVAWTSHDLDAAADYVADDVTFASPVLQFSGKRAYMDGLAAFARTITETTILAAFGDDAQALILYDVALGPARALTCAELLTFRDGKIASHLGTSSVRPAAQSPSAPPEPTA
ncbi:MAG TPA: nuclear transport factor 2 family protein [Ktedonobacterales bacterium]|jgi:hypothetical protein|nr:nuclear transport factor 2 family protein [Ktedonobacterales bacterium]